MTIIIPEMTRRDVPATRYTDPSTDVTYVRPGYEAEVGKNLVRDANGAFVGRQTPYQAMGLLAEKGLQLPTLSLLWHLAVTEGKESPLFYEAFWKDLDGNFGAPRTEHTGTVLRTPRGWESARLDGGKYVRNVFEYQDGELVQIAEAQRIPTGKARRFVNANPITGLPTEATDSDAEHLGHLWFTPELPETIMYFGSRPCNDEHDLCFDIYDGIASASTYWNEGFRPFRGKIPEIVIEGA